MFNNQTNEIKCISLGVGTKFLKFKQHRNDLECSNQINENDNINDMHAEVLAKRSFNLYLAQIYK